MKTRGGVAVRSWWRRCGAWLYGVVREKGWPRRILFAVAVIIALLAGHLLRTASAYRKEPASLVPRTVAMFIESKQIGPALRNFGAWNLWTTERREDGPDGWNSLQGEVMAFLNGQVAGLSTRPRKWLSSPIRGAFSSGTQEVESRESWAFYFYVENPAEVIADIQGEPGVTMETLSTVRNSTNGMYRMGDGRGGSLVLGSVGPWLILSSDEWLPKYALDVMSKPSLSLAGSGMLPKWGRAAVRGLYDPAKKTALLDMDGVNQVTVWIAEGARIGFTCRLHSDNRIETNFHTVWFSSASISGMFWPAVALVLWVLLLVCVALVIAILLTVIGLGAWIKFLAIRAGIHPASGPVAVTPSPAFQEDAGLAPVLTDTTMEVGRETAGDNSHFASAVLPEGTILTTEASLEDNPDREDNLKEKSDS